MGSVLRRGLAILRRLMRGPASRQDLLDAVREAWAPRLTAPTGERPNACFKNDRAALRKALEVEIADHRRAGMYHLLGMGGTAWLDLGDEELKAIGRLYNAFENAGSEGGPVRACCWITWWRCCRRSGWQ